VYPGEAVVEFLPVLRPSAFATKEELMEAVRTEMQAALERA
jgi:hypothetical protein